MDYPRPPLRPPPLDPPEDLMPPPELLKEPDDLDPPELLNEPDGLLVPRERLTLGLLKLPLDLEEDGREFIVELDLLLETFVPFLLTEDALRLPKLLFLVPVLRFSGLPKGGN